MQIIHKGGFPMGLLIFCHVYYSEEKSVSIKYKAVLEEKNQQIRQLQIQLEKEKEEQKKQLDLLDQEVRRGKCVCVGGGGEKPADSSATNPAGEGKGGAEKAARSTGSGGKEGEVCVWGGGEKNQQIRQLQIQLEKEKEEQKKQLDLLDQEVKYWDWGICVWGGGWMCGWYVCSRGGEEKSVVSPATKSVTKKSKGGRKKQLEFLPQEMGWGMCVLWHCP